MRNPNLQSQPNLLKFTNDVHFSLELKKNYKEVSEKRISIGLLIAEIGRVNNIDLDDNDYNNALQKEVQKYPGQEQQIIDFYKKNPDAIRNLTAPIYEDKVVDFVLEKVTLKDKKVSRKDLFGAEATQEKPKETKPGDNDGMLEYLEDIIGSNTDTKEINSDDETR